MLKSHLKQTRDIDVKDWLLKDVMKRELNLRYRRVKELSWQGNSDKNKILRQNFSKTLLEVDFTKKTIINVDETWIGQADFRKFKWCRAGESNSSPVK